MPSMVIYHRSTISICICNPKRLLSPALESFSCGECIATMREEWRRKRLTVGSKVDMVSYFSVEDETDVGKVAGILDLRDG